MILMIDCVLIVVLVEAIILTLLRRLVILPNLLAGFMLLVAMRLALGSSALSVVGLCLLTAGLAHLADLRLRLLTDRHPRT